MPIALVTGGAGFIGSHIVSLLLNEGWAVRVLDDFSTGRRENLQGLVGRLEIFEGDIRDSARLDEALRGVEVIFHQAAFVSVPGSMENPLACFDINVQGTANVLETARRHAVRRVVLASSAAVYGDADILPLEEETPLQPLSPYAASKRIDEIYAQLYTRSLGLEVVALRYFNVFGPRQRPDSPYAAAVPIFIRRYLDGKPVTVFGDGGQTRDLIYVGDVARANLLAAEHPDAPGQIFNICTGIETRLLDLLEILDKFFPAALAPVFSEPRPGDIYRSVGSPERAARVIGFRAQTSLEEGLRQTVAWMSR
jgi:nucleoside-diphosphate-sugar epimerase